MSVYLYEEECWLFAEDDVIAQLESCDLDPDERDELELLVETWDEVGRCERELTIPEAIRIAECYAGGDFGDCDERNGMAAALAVLLAELRTHTGWGLVR